jgi:hypothetical protein
MNSSKRNPRWPFFFIITGLFLLGVILPKIWDIHETGQTPVARIAEQPKPPERPRLEFPDAAVEFSLGDSPLRGPVLDDMPVLVPPSGKILAQAPGGDLGENAGSVPLAGEKNLVPQKEVVGESPAAAEEQNDVPALPTRDETASPGGNSSGSRINLSGVQAWLASRPKRLETLPELQLNGPRPEGEENSDLSENPAISPLPSIGSTRLYDANPQVSPTSSGNSAGVKKSWRDPEMLRKILEELAAAPDSASWASPVLEDLQALGEAMESNSPQAAPVLGRLAESAASASKVAQGLENYSLARKVRQAGYALQRRLDVWQSIYRLGAKSLAETDCPAPNLNKMALCLADLDSLTQGSAEGAQWRDYLLIEAIKEVARQREKSREIPPNNQSAPFPIDFLPEKETTANNTLSDGDRAKREVAQKLLARLIATPTTGSQREFLNSTPVMKYREQVQRLAAEPIAPADLLNDLERYERTRLGSDGRQLAFAFQMLALSANPDRRAIAEQLDRNYRNANLRVALSDEFINRLVPESQMEVSPVRETLLGVPVHGRSMTSTDVKLKLIPDPHRAQLALEIIGEVAAQTSSTSGPAMFMNDSESLISGTKQMEIDPKKGIRLLRSNVNVQSSTRLRGVQTDYDRIPIFGRIARGIAQNQYEMTREDAENEARFKMESKARQRLDAEARKRMSELVNRLNHHVFGPLDQLALEPTIVDAQTTEDRLTMRLRVAGDDQLGSHTPRPQAPTDCLASFQLNDSLLNNALARLQLEGKTMTLKELSERIAERFQRPDVWKVPPANEDVEVSFASKDPVRIQCTGGQVILELAIAQFSKPPRTWRNFHVRVFYRPQINGRKVELVRNGPNHLLAEGLSFGSQIALRGAFEKAFPSEQPVNVTPERLLSDPKLSDLQFTQMLIDDGWIGMALGTKEQAARTAMRK